MDDGVSQASPMSPAGGRLPPWTTREVRVLSLDPVGVAVPGACACCGAAASSSRVEVEPGGGSSLIVPYCDGCQRHASALTTRSLVAGLASAILALTLCLGLPLAWEHLGLMPFVGLVVLAALLPPIAIAIAPRKLEPGHSAIGRAAWWSARGSLVCTNARFATALARAAGIDARLERARESVISPWSLGGVIVALIAAPVVHRFHHPPVRVLNLTESRLVLLVDGRQMGSIEPTSSESPRAGIELRVPSGRRTLTVQAADETIVDRAHVDVESGAHHLYAPASDPYCFWLERSRYGRADTGHVERRALGGSVRFWVLPDDLDTWFAENPEPARRDQRSSGGELLALRQARCSVAPADVQNAGR